MLLIQAFGKYNSSQELFAKTFPGQGMELIFYDG
jgi:hypothetical protein